MVKGLAAQDGKRLQFTLSLEQLGFSGLESLANIERHSPAGCAGVTEDASTDGSGFRESMMTGPALAALAVKHAADGEHEPPPPAQVGAVFACFCAVCCACHVSPSIAEWANKNRSNALPAARRILSPSHDHETIESRCPRTTPQHFLLGVASGIDEPKDRPGRVLDGIDALYEVTVGG